MKKPRKYYEDHARDLLKNAREQRQITTAQLAELLRAHGEYIETQVLINKLNRGTFSLRFALQCLAAMGVRAIAVPDYITYKFIEEKSLRAPDK